MKAFFNQHQDVYNGTEPPIYDVQTIPEVKIIEDNYSTFKEELLAVINNEETRQKAFYKRSYAKSPNWTQIELMLYGLSYKDKIDLFPKTHEILTKIDGVSTIYFSFLDKSAKIKAHNGDTDAFHRIHLGINIPNGLPDCGMEVAGNQFNWKEGKCVAFNDIYFHSAWNLTDKMRIVLIIDLLLPKYRDQSDRVNSGVITTLILSRSYKYIGIIIELLPRILTRAIHPVLHFFVQIYFKAKKR